MEEIRHTPHIIILPSPGMGHLIPLTEFAKQLVFHHGFSATFTIPTDGPPSKAQKSVLDSLPSSINYIFLPPVNFDDLPADTRVETRMFLMVTRSMSSLRDVIETIVAYKRVVALVVDPFGTDAFDLAKEFNLPSYIFYTSTAMALSLFLQLPKMDLMYSCEYRDVPELIELPGCAPIHGRDLLDAVMDRSNDAYKLLINHCRRYILAEGIFVNSFIDLEPGAIKASSETKPGKPPVYPIGPMIQTGQAHGPDPSGCLKWLDAQPNGSVLFVSFGTGGTLSTEQSIELALGLEMSEQRFLWAVKSPSDHSASESYFTAQSGKDPLGFLPKYFLDRTKGLGLLVPSWTPQIQVLGHDSTGGFLTHCGWNSVLESVVHGVPLITWPLFAEQKMNMKILVDDMKVGMRPQADENGLISRSEIAMVVKSLIVGEKGEELRNQMNKLKNAARNALSENGSSSKSLAEVALKWKMR